MSSFLAGKWAIRKSKSEDLKLYKRKLALIFIILFLGLNTVDAQKIDSLKFLLKEKSGLERCDVLYQLAYEYVDFDNQYGLKYATEAFKAAKENSDSLRIVKAGRIKSLVFRRLGKMDSALILSSEILPIAKRNNYLDELNQVLTGLANVYIFKAFYDKALICYFQALELRQMKGNKSEISITADNIGLVYYKMKDYDKALSYYKKSLQLKNEAKYKYDLDLLLINISLCYGYKNNFIEAKNFIDQAFEVCGKNCSKYLQLQARFSLGIISLGSKDFLDAETQFLESYALAKMINNERLQFDNIVYLSQIYIRRNELVLAERYLSDAERLIASGTPYNLELIKVYNGLFKLYAKSGNFEKVARYQQKYIQLKDSIYSEELTRNLTKVEAEYLERENKAKIDAQSKILALDEKVIVRQRFLNLFIGIVAVLLIVLAFVLVRSNRRKRMVNQILEQKVKERTTELEINSSVLQRSLEERNVQLQKISTDIKNSLATIKGLCFLGLKDSDAPGVVQYIHKIDVTSDQLLNTLNRTFSNAILVD